MGNYVAHIEDSPFQRTIFSPHQTALTTNGWGKYEMLFIARAMEKINMRNFSERYTAARRETQAKESLTASRTVAKGKTAVELDKIIRFNKAPTTVAARLPLQERCSLKITTSEQVSADGGDHQDFARWLTTDYKTSVNLKECPFEFWTLDKYEDIIVDKKPQFIKCPSLRFHRTSKELIPGQEITVDYNASPIGRVLCMFRITGKGAPVPSETDPVFCVTWIWGHFVEGVPRSSALWQELEETKKNPLNRLHVFILDAETEFSEPNYKTVMVDIRTDPPTLLLDSLAF